MRSLHLHVVVYEENWGTRFARRLHKFYFDKKPTRKRALAVIRKRVTDRAQEDWFDYGPLSMGTEELAIY